MIRRDVKAVHAGPKRSVMVAPGGLWKIWGYHVSLPGCLGIGLGTNACVGLQNLTPSV